MIDRGMDMRVLVIGGGGREHALCWKIAQSQKVDKVYCAPGNPGIASVAENVDIPVDDIDALMVFALENKIGLTVVGPEQPLVAGIVDRFNDKGLRIFGPSKNAAEIEGSKVFCKDLLANYEIPTAAYKVFDCPTEAMQYVADRNGLLVVKADGLVAGKGVLICSNGEEAADAIKTVMEEKAFGDAGNQIVVEEFLEGQEVSLLAFTDGKILRTLDSAQDHKAVYDGDTGPNTGGMGAYSPAAVLTEKLKKQVIDEIMFPTLRAMEKEDCLYKGLLYAGLMLTKEGPKVLEFNARFGDPETQPLMLRLQNDIVPIFEACIDGTLDRHTLNWKPESAVCVVMASKGYPGSYEKGKPISGLNAAGQIEIENVVVFHAGTKSSDGKIATSGGRVLGVTALGKDVPSAISTAYDAVSKIQWDGIHYRKDIGHRAH